MKFSQLTLNVNSADIVFAPYDRGAKGAFVYRKVGSSVHSPRIVASATIDDMASDRFALQLNEPRITTDSVSGVDTVIGTDLLKIELRFLATTAEADRNTAVDTLVALLVEFKQTIGSREAIYA